ncbi:MAG: TIM barrel protein [Abditibacteriaceae bacterium]
MQQHNQPGLKYALCIESIFPGMDYAERIQHTIDTGFNAVEVWGVDDDKKKVLLDAKERGVRTAFLVGASGFATNDKNHIAAELENLKRNIDLAHELDCPNICLFVGDRDPNLIYDQGRAAVIDFLGQAAKVLSGSGIAGVIESLSPLHHPQGFANNMRDVISWAREVNQPEIQLQFDVYHTAMTDPDVESLVRDSIDITAYYQAADAPGRGQPGTGILNFDSILNTIKKSTFDGYFAWEYAPQGDVIESIEQTKKVQI